MQSINIPLRRAAAHSPLPVTDDEPSAEQLEGFRLRLLALRQELLDKQHQDRGELRQPQRASDEHDQATLAEGHWLSIQLREHDRAALREIDAALDRIARGDYGYCEETGEPIGIARLRARPTARLCVEAQARRERLARLRGRLN